MPRHDNLNAKDELCDPFQEYIRATHEIPQLTSEEEKELVVRIQQGDKQAREHMIRANLLLVVFVSRKYLKRGVLHQDLIQEGNIGLMRATETFDLSFGVRFSTYAFYWIEQSMKLAIIKTGKPIRMPLRMVRMLAQWKQAHAALHAQLGREPTKQEIARTLPITEHKLAMLMQAISIDGAEYASDSQEYAVTTLIASNEESPLDRAITNEDTSEIKIELGRMANERERTILEMRFGINGHEQHTLEEVGKKLRLSRERVRQIEDKALRALKKIMSEPTAPAVTRSTSAETRQYHEKREQRC